MVYIDLFYRATVKFEAKFIILFIVEIVILYDPEKKFDQSESARTYQLNMSDFRFFSVIKHEGKVRFFKRKYVLVKTFINIFTNIIFAYRMIRMLFWIMIILIIWI